MAVGHCKRLTFVVSPCGLRIAVRLLLLRFISRSRGLPGVLLLVGVHGLRGGRRKSAGLGGIDIMASGHGISRTLVPTRGAQAEGAIGGVHARSGVGGGLRGMLLMLVGEVALREGDLGRIVGLMRIEVLGRSSDGIEELVDGGALVTLVVEVHDWEKRERKSEED